VKLTVVFVNKKRVNICEHTLKIASTFVPIFVLSIHHYFPFHLIKDKENKL
jgi:hypothetical protein